MADTETNNGVFVVSNKARLGISEFTAVKMMYDGVKKLIEMEKAGKKHFDFATFTFFAYFVNVLLISFLNISLFLIVY